MADYDRAEDKIDPEEAPVDRAARMDADLRIADTLQVLSGGVDAPDALSDRLADPSGGGRAGEAGEPEGEGEADMSAVAAVKRVKAGEGRKKGGRRTVKRSERVASARPRAARAPLRDVSAGVRKSPKNKILFVNSAAALALVRKAIEGAMKGGSLTEDERFHAERLMLRIDARS